MHEILVEKYKLIHGLFSQHVLNGFKGLYRLNIIHIILHMTDIIIKI